MNPTTIRLRDWAINKIKMEYPEDIALLIGVPSGSVNNDGHGEPFDYFIPCTERGYELSQTFIIDGVGNDLYPRDWERTIRTANLEDMATLCLGDGVILYARSKEDEERFEVIRQQLFDNLANPIFIYTKAVEQMEHAMNQYKNMMFEDELYKVRAQAGFVQYYLMMAVNCLNGTYWKAWHNGVIPALNSLKALPYNFIELYKQMLGATNIDELRSISHTMIRNTRDFVTSQKARLEEAQQLLDARNDASHTQRDPDYLDLADWYQELRTTFNRLYFYCESKNADATFADAVNLQNELLTLCDSFPLEHVNLLGLFDETNLILIQQRAMEIEGMIRNLIQQNHIDIKEYSSVDDFLACN